MDLEEKKVLLKNRFNPFVSRKKKEWWYTGILDRKNDIYLGFSVIRVMFMDSISVSLFDPKNPGPVSLSWKGYLDRANPPNRLSLIAKGKSGGAPFSFSYTGSSADGWLLDFSGAGLSASLSMAPTIKHFTKFDNLFVDEYTVLHFFMNRATGSIAAGDKTYEVKDALSYYDHCFGTVPSKTKWHWIAVQSETCALDSLMNYGAYAQCYTEAFFTGNAPESARGRWIRLDQDVSFECYHHDRFSRHWRITSPDMHLKLEVIQTSCERERIPPLVPFLVDLDHWQCSVKAHGWVRVDGEWIETGELRGVLEEHHGKW